MDYRRFTDGGDMDATNINLIRIPNYYNMPIVGAGSMSLYPPYIQAQAQDRFEEKMRLLHIRLRRQMDIPDDAFEPLSYGLDNVTGFTPLVFKQEYSQNNRVTQLRFQKRLDFFVKKYYEESCTELDQMLKQNRIINSVLALVVIIICLLLCMLHVF